MDWSLLPTDLVEKIGCHLPLIDYLRLGAVCVSWCCATRPTREKRYPPAANQLPWLVLCDEDDVDDKEIGNHKINKIRKRGFFNLTKNKLYHLDIPEAYGKRFCGSTDGWLVTVDGDQQLHLLNPFSRAQIQLPPISTFRREPEEFDSDGEQDDRNSEPEYWRDVYIYKVLIFSSPSSSNPSSDFLVVAIYGQFGKLAFCKAGDKLWTTIETPIGRFHDLIRYKEELYAITCGQKIYTCDLRAPEPKAIEFGAERLVRDPCNQRYLVESSGDLLQVSRKVYEGVEEDDPHKTIRFDVFKLDVTKKNWVELESLGDRILFVGYNSSISLSSREIPGSKGNLIYFTDDLLECYLYDKNTDLGVFNLEDDTIEPYYPPSFHPARSPPIWVTPNPW